MHAVAAVELPRRHSAAFLEELDGRVLVDEDVLVDHAVVAEVDAGQRSTVPGLYLAGELTGVGGAALATVVSQALSVVLCLEYIRRRIPVRQMRRSDWRVTRADLAVPDVAASSAGGRQGSHATPMGHILAEMQVLARRHPGASW